MTIRAQRDSGAKQSSPRVTSMSPRYPTPLRYPGGKQRLGPFFSQVLSVNHLVGGHYVELFAGGAGVALYLLHNQLVTSAHLNDIDRSVYAFWYAVTHRNERLCNLVRNTRVCVSEWDRQKDIQRHKKDAPLLELGFSTLFLNRTNRSGIMRAGMIGGRRQKGRYRLDARFNKESIIKRIQTINCFRKQITLSCMDARDFLEEGILDFPKRSLFYLDPPYIRKSRDLYLNHYKEADHSLLAKTVRSRLDRPWVMTYDDCSAVRRLYRGFAQRTYHLGYSADKVREGCEVMILANNVCMPRVASDLL